MLKTIFLSLVWGIFLVFSSCNTKNSTKNIQDINLNENVSSQIIFNIIDEIKSAKKSNNFNLQIEKNIELADIFIQIYETDQSLKYLQTALLLAKNNNKQENLNTIYYKIGNIYLLNNDYEKAKEYFSKSYRLSVLQNEGDNIISDLMKLGFVFHKQNKLDSARYYYKKIITIIEANDSKKILPLLYNKLGNLYLDEGLFNEAKLLYKKGIDTSLFYNNTKYLDGLYLNLGKTYSGLNKFDSAHYSFLNCDSLIHNNSALKTECNYWLLRNRIVEKSKLELIKYLDDNKLIADSITNTQNRRWKRYAEFNYKLGKNENELILLQERNYNQNLRFIFVFIVLVLIGLIIFIVLRNKNKKINQKLLLVSKENEITKLKEKQLQDETLKMKKELEIKHKEILSNSLILLNKNELIENLKNNVKKIQVIDNKDNKSIVDNILSLLRDYTNQDNIWNDFKIHFEKVHQDFFDKLKQKHPDLTENDTRLCAYLMIGMQNQEIANISFISPESVRKRKQRLREKLGLETGKDISGYIKLEI